MATIAQRGLFGWEEIEALGDLERLRLVLEALPDEELMRKLEAKRGKGRNEYPIRAMWNSLLAGVVFQHESVAKLRRELMRNAQLRQVCGFEALKGVQVVPSAWAYTRFVRLLMRYSKDLQGLFEELVRQLGQRLPELGRTLAVDSKGIRSHGRPRPQGTGKGDGRGDGDANRGVKTYRGVREDGSTWEKVKSWFGYKLHLVVDAEYELPVGFEVTKASCADAPVAHRLLEQLAERQPGVLENSEYLLGDKAYDDGKLLEKAWEQYRIKPVIAIRECWQQGDAQKTKVLPGTTNVIYDEQGTVSCCCVRTGEVRAMAYGGFEKDRGTLKYRCPAAHYGVDCKGRGRCPLAASLRIPLSEDRRVFTPVARSSYAWKEIYRKRTAVERVNSRLDVSFGFERHFIRGMKKMTLQCTIALAVMLAMALGRVKENQTQFLRSLVRAA